MTEQQEIHNRIAARLLQHVETLSTDQAEDLMRVPSASYTDPAQWQREMEQIFKRLPILAGLSGEIAQPGQYKAFDLLGTPLLLTRLRDGSVRAMLNVCAHRAMRLAEGSGKCERFACPYHAWVYGNDGNLLRIAGQDTYGDVDKAALGLTQLPVYERAGLIFVVLTPGLEVDFAGYLGGMIEDIEQLGFADWHYCGNREIHGGNWKVAYDGYLEGYHFAAAHPQTIHQRTYSNIMGFHFYGPHQLIGFPQKDIKARLQGVPADELHLHENHGYDFVRTLFPNVSIFVAPEITQVAQLIPGPTVGENRTVLHFIHRHAPENDEQRQANEAMMDWLRDVVDTEDYSLGLKIQGGLASGAFQHVTFGRNELGNQEFHRWINHYLADAPATPQVRADDEAEIEALLQQYACAIDQRNLELLDQVFTADSLGVYPGAGEFAGARAIAGFIDSAIARCAVTQHMLGNIRIDLNGSRATSRSYLQALHVGVGEHADDLQLLWGEYRDELEKRPQGWRIVRRELVTLHSQGDIGLLG
ncbi:SRPBCC family protein [Pseudomonas jinjuensis]|uniref:Phenylpropionate dioxygenase, large terminal subunit n=1 Tax=Pseudomonas jinjuensis TaxID=198616 RepID=A0A1H0EJ25_9PSED|nr:SRPBCC family protein [Pseudomonas jinjuensis]SDN82279.1 Phenylpropionate dioxygenase, large terminal subunit [Pseudomonas jinjuensis]